MNRVGYTYLILIASVNLQKETLPLRRVQAVLYVPESTGEFMVSFKSIVAPEGIDCGRSATFDLLSFAPERKMKSVLLESQACMPVFLTVHVTSKSTPGATTEPSAGTCLVSSHASAVVGGANVGVIGVGVRLARMKMKVGDGDGVRVGVFVGIGVGEAVTVAVFAEAVSVDANAVCADAAAAVCAMTVSNGRGVGTTGVTSVERSQLIRKIVAAKKRWTIHRFDFVGFPPKIDVWTG